MPSQVAHLTGLGSRTVLKIKPPFRPGDSNRGHDESRQTPQSHTAAYAEPPQVNHRIGGRVPNVGPFRRGHTYPME